MIALLVIRHAPTDWNESGLIQGRRDRPLSAEGRRRAMAWCVPPGWSHARCMASPLARALETARLMGLDPRPEPGLIEMAWGDFEGRRLSELRAEGGAPFAQDERRGLDFRPPGGESPRDVQDRLRPLLQSLAAPTIAVTHKGVLRALYALATGWDMRDRPAAKLLPACAHQFWIGRDGEPRLAELNMPLEHAP